MEGAQINDLNPGIRQSGLFWTTVVSAESVNVDLAAGTASLEANDIHVFDFGDFVNAAIGGGAQPIPATASFRVEWTCSDAVEFNNASQKFRGAFKTGSARMAWSARVRDLEFASGLLESSSSDFAELGHENNGSFY